MIARTDGPGFASRVTGERLHLDLARGDMVVPGGVAVVSECVRPGKDPPPSYVDFVFNFLTSFTNVTLDPVLRPNHGFLSPAAWRASFAAAGFGDVTLVPDVDAVAARYPKFFVGAVAARP